MAKRKILLVDDEIDFLQLLKVRLEANDYNVVTAMNGREALEKFKLEKSLIFHCLNLLFSLSTPLNITIPTKTNP